MQEINGNGESKIRKVLFNEVSLFIGIIAVVLSAFIYMNNPAEKNNTALLLQEERITAQRTTIDALTKTQQNDMVEVKVELNEIKDKLDDVCLLVKELATIINERIPTKK